MKAALGKALLRLLVQIDAFSISPWAYLQGMVWRIRGLRLRSGIRFSTLAGRSPRAYRLWMMASEPEIIRQALPDTSNIANSEIIVIIDCRHHHEGVEATVKSVRASDPLLPIILWSAEASSSADPTIDGLPVYTTADEVTQAVRKMRLAWLCPLMVGDRLAPAAVPIYRTAIHAAGEANIIYADDDLIDNHGRRHTPHFKPDWNKRLFCHHDYVSGASIIRSLSVKMDELDNNDWPGALARRALMESNSRPVHIPVILHHRIDRPEPIIPSPCSIATNTELPGITAIIPTRNQLALLRDCVEGLFRTDYPDLDCIIMDNDSDDPDTLNYLSSVSGPRLTVIKYPGPFNYSAINNTAAHHAKGKLLCFLNNDIVILDDKWLTRLAKEAIKQDVGAVGAKLLYPDGRIQHAGVVLGIGGAAAQAHRFQDNEKPGYFSRAYLPQEVSAVTGACMVVNRDKFMAVGGFDEIDFPVAFNDVDLCLKLNARGWQSVYEPAATLVHHESVSRGNDLHRSNRVRFSHELAALKRKWGTDRIVDPYHHPHLSRECEAFVIAL